MTFNAVNHAVEEILSNLGIRHFLAIFALDPKSSKFRDFVRQFVWSTLNAADCCGVKYNICKVKGSPCIATNEILQGNRESKLFPFLFVSLSRRKSSLHYR
jgi:hypothetical protein